MSSNNEPATQPQTVGQITVTRLDDGVMHAQEGLMVMFRPQDNDMVEVTDGDQTKTMTYSAYLQKYNRTR